MPEGEHPAALGRPHRIEMAPQPEDGRALLGRQGVIEREAQCRPVAAHRATSTVNSRRPTASGAHVPREKNRWNRS